MGGRGRRSEAELVLGLHARSHTDITNDLQFDWALAEAYRCTNEYEAATRLSDRRSFRRVAP